MRAEPPAARGARGGTPAVSRVRRLAGAVVVAGALGAGLSGCALFDAAPVRAAPATPAAREGAGPLDVRATPLAVAVEDDWVVRVVVGDVSCTGALIDDARVLTAHHCVSERDRHGEYVAQDVAPASVRIELGGAHLPWGEVGVRAIVAPPCGHAGGTGDIAILVLDRELAGLDGPPVRLGSPPVVGELVEPLGFGRCALSHDGIRRKARVGGRIASVHRTRVRVPASICPGDSGGPVLDEAGGEIVGIVSASVMDGDERTRALSELTRLDRWRPVFAASQLVADGASPAELPPIAGCGG